MQAYKMLSWEDNAPLQKGHQIPENHSITKHNKLECSWLHRGPFESLSFISVSFLHGGRCPCSALPALPLSCGSAAGWRRGEVGSGSSGGQGDVIASCHKAFADLSVNISRKRLNGWVSSEGAAPWSVRSLKPQPWLPLTNSNWPAWLEAHAVLPGRP